MNTLLVIQAYGEPKPQGSTRAFVRGGRAVTTSANPNLRPWRDTVAWAARDAMLRNNWKMLTGGVGVDLVFWMPRPKSAPRTRDILPIRGADLDKLIRSVNDSLTNAGVFNDDAQIVRIRADEYYAVGPHLSKIYNPEIHRAEPGVTIIITALEERTP